MTNSTLRLRRNLIATSCLVAAGALAPLAAHADDATAAAGPAAPANVTAASDAAAASASVAPIIVTAERREVNIQKRADLRSPRSPPASSTSRSSPT